MRPQLTHPCPSILAVVPKSVAQLEREGDERIARTRYYLDLGRSKTPQASPAHPLPYGPVSVAAWLLILSPEQMARYAFTAYNLLLRMTAMETIQNHDFATEGVFGRDFATYENLRQAMREGYESGTVDIRLNAGVLSLDFYVPGGGLTHWPVQLPVPERRAETVVA